MKFLSFDFLSAVVFILVMGLILYRNRSKITVQRLVSLPKSMWNIPLVYLLLLRTKMGLKFIDRFSSKHREAIKLFGYSCIGIGFLGMIVILVSMAVSVFLIFFRPEVQNVGFGLVLPFTNIPGLGYLSFWHFIISIFILALIHEFAHGVVARAHGLEVKSSGIGVISLLAPLVPVAFVEPDEETMQKKDDYVQYSIFAAGPVVNILFAVLCALLLSFVFTPVQEKITEPVGFSFTLTNSSLPAAQAGIVPGIINSINNHTVKDFYDFQYKMICIRPDEEITLNTSNGTYSLVTTTAPDDNERALIGITAVQNERKIKDKYKPISGTFSWFQGLFRWLFNLNLAIGLVNLLPLLIVDGGRMFQIATKKIIRDREKANRIIRFIGLLLLLFILIGLWKSYGGFLTGPLSRIFSP